MLMTAHVTERFALVEGSFSAHRTLNRPGKSSRRMRDTFMLSLQRKGNVIVSQGNREAQISPRDVFLINTASPFAIETQRMSCLSLFLPGPPLRRILPDIDDYTAIPIIDVPGPAALFADLLDALARNVSAFDEAAANGVANSLPHMLAAALRSLKPQQFVRHEFLDEQYADQIRAFARLHLSDPELTCEQVAEGVALSVRHVHQVFARQPTTLMNWVWNERLANSRRDLAAPEKRHLSIGEIAFSWGFSDLGHFSRSFKKAYGAAPRLFRQEHM